MLRKLLPHAAIIISMMYFVFFFIDRVNSAMAFIDNDITKGLLFALCVISIFNALRLIHYDRRSTRQKMKRLEEKQRQQREQQLRARRSTYYR